MTAPGTTRYMGFVGVTTSGSSIMRIFPEWARILDLPTARLHGHDLPMDASREQYRDLVRKIRDDDSHLGALVTTHKVRLYEAAHDLFDEIDGFGQLCGEISSISKRNGRLIGHAKDPITAGLSIEEFLPGGYFRESGAHVVCLGAGGAGTALAWYLTQRPDMPARIVCTDTSDDRLSALQAMLERGTADREPFAFVRDRTGAETTAVLEAAPAGTLVVNASGLGKDRPGSPVPDGALFPQHAYVWEFNYRGTLEFLAQARSQEAARGLTVVDGWRYFIHGWSQVIAEVFGVELDEDLLRRLSGGSGSSAMSFIRTVLGDRDPGDLGMTNYHEHLFQVTPLLPGDELDDEEKSLAEARLLAAAGTRTMVDATPLGLGRNPAALARISAVSGMNVVASTGRHRQQHYPGEHWTGTLDERTLANLFVRDLLAGCPVQDGPASAGAVGPGGEPVRAGLLKAGIGYWSVTGFERQTLEAVAIAHGATSAPVMVHLEHCTAAHEVLDLLAGSGVPSASVILAHADRNPDAGLHLELAARGAFLGYDGMARPRAHPDSTLIALIADVVDGGGAGQLLLGGDVARSSRYLSYGGMPGLAYLPLRFLPRLRTRVGDAVVVQLTEANPARALAWHTD